ncbi:MAG: histidinol-phosphate transaminase [Shinella sp.]|nr:histidinol-phosphate transaminase [Shinella sp.]
MAESFPLVRPEIAALSPYNAGLTIAEVKSRYNPARIAKLGSNENPLGPSPEVRNLVADGELFRLYPDPSGRALADALACEFSLSREQIILGNGSEDLIAVICRTVLRPGDHVVTLYPSFPLHEDYATLMGAVVERVDLRENLTIDVDALVAAVAKPARMVIFANPMNPVGSWLSPQEMRRVLDALPERTLLVVDEAYAEYAAGEDYPSAAEMLASSGRNWIVLRTFSKAYGLAGLRLGFGLVGDPGLTTFLDRARTPFNTNAVAQAAGLIARSDRAHVERTVALAVAERMRIGEALASKGLKIAPSKGNFLFFDTGRESSAVAEALLRDGVIVKPWKQPGYETFIRVSIGSPDENDHFLEALDNALAR